MLEQKRRSPSSPLPAVLRHMDLKCSLSTVRYTIGQSGQLITSCLFSIAHRVIAKAPPIYGHLTKTRLTIFLEFIHHKCLTVYFIINIKVFISSWKTNLLVGWGLVCKVTFHEEIKQTLTLHLNTRKIVCKSSFVRGED